jgi:hypothetical protein
VVFMLQLHDWNLSWMNASSVATGLSSFYSDSVDVLLMCVIRLVAFAVLLYIGARVGTPPWCAVVEAYEKVMRQRTLKETQWRRNNFAAVKRAAMATRKASQRLDEPLLNAGVNDSSASGVHSHANGGHSLGLPHSSVDPALSHVASWSTDEEDASSVSGRLSRPDATGSSSAHSDTEVGGEPCGAQ